MDVWKGEMKAESSDDLKVVGLVFLSAYEMVDWKDT
jgi:hypothetical protein